MNAWKLAAGVLLAALYGCSAEHAESVSGNAGFQGETGKPGTALAYEHRVGIRLSAARIDAQLAASRDACNSERFGQCDVLAIEQRGGIGHYAELTVRIVPDGVEKLVAAAAQGGTLESRQTRAEDLAQAVADTRQQRERLQREYQTLQQYQGRKDMSVGDLLALAKEIAAVEAQLADNAQAGAQQQRRIATNLLTLSFSSEAQPDSRLGQLATAAGQLLDDLVDGTIAAMKFFALSPGIRADREGPLFRPGPPDGPGNSQGGRPMTATSDLIESLISYSWDDWQVTRQEARRVIAAIRNDNVPDATIAALDKSGSLIKLFQRVGPPELARSLIASIAGRTTMQRYQARNALIRSLINNPLGTQTDNWIYFPTITFFGATGVNPADLPSIAFGDQLKLLNKDPATVTKYSNPLGDLGAYLSQLSPQDKLNQAQTLVGQPISTLFPDAYPGNPPSRAKVMSAAARKYDLTPQLIGAIILAEQRDQTRDEDAKDYQAAVSIKSANTSIGLGQVVVSTAIKYELFTDLLGQPVRRGLSRKAVATLLASDEFNIFATARYIRYVANLASQQDLRKLPKTRGAFPSIDLRAYAGNPRNWPRDNVRALASEYTSRPWDDNLSPGWPMFVDDAYATFLDPGMRFP